MLWLGFFLFERTFLPKDIISTRLALTLVVVLCSFHSFRLVTINMWARTFCSGSEQAHKHLRFLTVVFYIFAQGCLCYVSLLRLRFVATPGAARQASLALGFCLVFVCPAHFPIQN